jgi:AMMECR1 domain-containing protein
MKNYDDIEVGKHGLILEESGRRGLLLPQVPIEHGMDKEQFLDAICRKSGVSQNLWREKVLNISLFTATVIDEKDLEDNETIN